MAIEKEFFCYLILNLLLTYFGMLQLPVYRKSIALAVLGDFYNFS